MPHHPHYRPHWPAAASSPCSHARPAVQVFLSMDVPALTCAVLIRRLAPLIDSAAATAMFVYNPFRWWLSDSHAGTAILLGVLYAMLVQLEVLALYPISGPVATWDRRRVQRRVHALLLWLLHMNFVLGMCSAYMCAPSCPPCLDCTLHACAALSSMPGNTYSREQHSHSPRRIAAQGRCKLLRSAAVICALAQQSCAAYCCAVGHGVLASASPHACTQRAGRACTCVRWLFEASLPPPSHVALSAPAAAGRTQPCCGWLCSSARAWCYT